MAKLNKDNNEILISKVLDKFVNQIESDNISKTDLKILCNNIAKETANLKDKTLKRFFVEFIDIPDKVETNENGELLAESYVEKMMKRLKAAESIFNNYKKFENRIN